MRKTRRVGNFTWYTRLSLLSILIAACHADFVGVPTSQSAAVALGAGVASPLNAFIAVGETLSVSLRATTQNGAAIITFDSVRYVLPNPTDTQYVQVSSTGLVTGRAPSPPSPIGIWIVGFKDGAWAADEALVTVTASAMPHPVLQLLSNGVHVASANALAYSSFSSKHLVDSSGTPNVSRMVLRFEYRSQDSANVSCFYDLYAFSSQGRITIPNTALQNRCVAGVYNQSRYFGYADFYFYKAGTVVVYANVLAYGIPVRDSVVVTVGNPISGRIAIDAPGLLGGAFNTLNATIAPGGTVTFRSIINGSFGTSMDFVFDRPEAVTASPDTVGAPTGNIRGLLGNGPAAIRQFNTPGTYGYTAKITAGVAPFLGIERRGTIVVQ